VAADLQDEGAIAALCHQQDCVFHCGALSEPWGDFKLFYDINVLGTRHIVQGCLTHNVPRLIHVSTSAVYFTYAHQLQIKETQPLPKPVNAYAHTKQLAEQEVMQGHQQGLSTFTIRPRGIFGPGDTTLLPRLLRANDRTGIPLIRQGQALIDVTYHDNVIAALRCCQQAPSNLSGNIYNITNGEPIKLIDLLTSLSQQLGYPFRYKALPFRLGYAIATALESTAALFNRSEPILTRYTLGLLAFSQTLDIRKARSELGYHPPIALAEGLTRFAKSWKKQRRQ
jgi:nucleoside-diphosphate-sugar epimerase